MRSNLLFYNYFLPRYLQTIPGKKFATIFYQADNHIVRVWDCQTGYSITGPLTNGTKLTKLSFADGDNKIIAWPEFNKGGTPGIATVWDIGAINSKIVPQTFIEVIQAMSLSNKNSNLDTNHSSKDEFIISKINEAINSDELEDKFKSFLKWTKEFTTIRSDSPFRDRFTPEYSDLLSKQNELGLIQEALRINHVNSLAIARGALFKLIENEGNIYNSVLEINLAKELNPEDSEIKLYNSMLLELANQTSNADELFKESIADISLNLNQLVRVNEFQKKFNIDIEKRLKILELASEKAQTEKSERLKRSLIVEKFILCTNIGKFADAKSAWNKIKEWDILPAGNTPESLKALYANLIESEADRLANEKNHSEAAKLIQPIAISSLVDDNDVISSSLVKLIEWENINNPPLTFIPKDAEWFYLDDGSDPTTENSEWKDSSVH